MMVYGRGAAWILLVLLVLGFASGPGATAEEAEALPPLDAETYAAYRAQILPSEAERAWEQIEWHPSYAEGLREASKQQKPLLLWVMNGHPLGCT